jgi:hypothetical protein
MRVGPAITSVAGITIGVASIIFGSIEAVNAESAQTNSSVLSQQIKSLQSQETALQSKIVMALDIVSDLSDLRVCDPQCPCHSVFYWCGLCCQTGIYPPVESHL